MSNEITSTTPAAVQIPNTTDPNITSSDSSITVGANTSPSEVTADSEVANLGAQLEQLSGALNPYEELSQLAPGETPSEDLLSRVKTFVENRQKQLDLIRMVQGFGRW